METKKQDQKQLTEKTAVATEKKDFNTVKLPTVEKQIEEKKPTVEELQKKVEALQKKLLSAPQSLEERIKYLQLKQQLVKRLNVLNMYQTSVNDFIQVINEEAETDILTTENFCVEFQAKENGRYNTKEVLKIQNPSIVLELFKFASIKIGDQIKATEKQINE